ncbi:MAG TPA: sigma-70 family RNA polymerase sigma factor [Planctomycetota bacterium]|nr:sigma-70 family RNA polymerase sigma factor [Planctomycetota bacterium]
MTPRSRAARFEAEAAPHLDALYRTAARLARSPADAEDLVQDGLLKAFRFFDSWKPGTNFKAWLMRVLYTTFVSGRRSAGPPLVDLDAVGELETPADALVRELDRPDYAEREAAVLEAVDDRIKAAVDSLPEELRVVFLLATVEDLKYREIAEVIGRPLGTVMSRLFRARKALQDRLADVARADGRGLREDPR